MGNQGAEVVEELPSARTIKVHARMCSELLNPLTRISKIFPEIEAARPRCSSGIDALCLLNNGITKAKSLLQHCTESSALYLALTGEAILSRCKKSRNLLEQSLSQIQNMVPVMLAAKISGIIADLRSASFCLDPYEEEAGKLLRELLHRYGSTIDSTEESALSAIHTVSSRLHMSSQKAILIEKRSIRKLLEKFGENEPSKRRILLFFFKLLNKYGKTMTTNENGSSDNEAPFPFPSSYNHLSSEMELRVDYGSTRAQMDLLGRPVPPDEFICPLSSRLMHDPVVISSGQSYERTWIQEWFDEGHRTCPKTNIELAHFSFTSNTGMKDLIMKWCENHGVSIPYNPKVREKLLWETSTNSIASLTSSMNEFNLPLDFSNVSLGSSHGSDMKKRSREIDTEFISKANTLPWDYEDVKRLLKDNKDCECWSVIPSEKFVQLLLRFLRDAHELRDVEAQMTGCLLLLEFVQKYRNSISYMKEDAYALLASLLDTEVSKQALFILEALSFHQQCANKISSSNALTGILNILDSQIQELLQPALKILSNLSPNEDVISFIVLSNIIPKLIPFIDQNTLSTYCATIFKNLCQNENGRMSIVETNGCIGSVVKLLEKENRDEQEIAVSILLSLCSQRADFCELVMDEGVIPGLVSVSINGNERANAMAMELLRILKDESDASREASKGVEVVSVIDSSNKQRKDKNPPKGSGLFGKLFSKKK